MLAKNIPESHLSRPPSIQPESEKKTLTSSKLTYAQAIGSVVNSRTVLADSAAIVPSNVLILHTLPEKATRDELISVLSSFGQIHRIVVLSQRNSALVEFDSIASAQAVVDSQKPVMFQDVILTFHYSDKPSIDAAFKKSIDDAQNLSAISEFDALNMMAADTSSALQSGVKHSVDSPLSSFSFDESESVRQQYAQGDSHSLNLSSTPNAMYKSTSSINSVGDDVACHILHCIIHSAYYPITVDLLEMLFSPYGALRRLLIFLKNDMVQALIEFCDVESAIRAKDALNYQFIYEGCCQLAIHFSRLSKVLVDQETERSRDYEKRSAITSSTQENSVSRTLSNHYQHNQNSIPQQPSQMFLLPQQQSHFSPSSFYHALSESNALNAYFTAAMHPEKMKELLASAAAAASQLNGIQSLGSVLHVSGLDERVNCHMLFVLFGVYGDVKRVRKLKKTKSCALVQMTNPVQAALVLHHLRELPLYGKKLVISVSPHMDVFVNKEIVDEENEKDYTRSALHRFRTPNSKNFANIYGPSQVLHMSNLPMEYDLDELGKKCECFGRVVKMKKIADRMVLVEMTSLEESVNALVNLHDAPLDDRYRLRVSFSKDAKL